MSKIRGKPRAYRILYITWRAAGRFAGAKTPGGYQRAEEILAKIEAFERIPVW